MATDSTGRLTASPDWALDDTAELDRDRLRLAHGTIQDFDDFSLSSVGLPEAGDMDTDEFQLPPPAPLDGDNDESSFDISQDANGMSTRKLNIPEKYGIAPLRPGQNVLPPDSPTIDSAMLREQFADFSMAVDGEGAHTRDFDLSSPEVGRGQQNDSLFDFSLFSSGGPKAAATTVAGARNKKGASKTASPPQKSTAKLDFSPSKITPKKSRFSTGERLQRLSSGGSDKHPSKIADFVSSAGSAGSKTKFMTPAQRHVDSEDEALSDIGASVMRPKLTFERRASASSEPAGRGRNATLKTQKAASTNKVPKAFKSTAQFLSELGLDGHTQTIQMQQKLDEMKDIRRPSPDPTRVRTVRPPSPSIAIPKLPDLTELFSMNDITRFSKKKGASVETHIPISEVPVPPETRALLIAMQLLQEKVNKLENTKAKNQAKCARLEAELRRVEIEYQNQVRARQAERDERMRRGREDSTFGGSDDGDAEETQIEKVRVEWMMEKLKLQSVIDNLKRENDRVGSELETANIAMRNMQHDRHSAVNSVAAAICSGEDLKAANNELERQLEQLRLEKDQADLASQRQREEFKAREERLKRRAEKARESAAAAERAREDALRRDAEARLAAERELARHQREEARKQERQKAKRREKEQQEREELQRAEQERERIRRRDARIEFDRQVQEKLRRMRPDLFEGRESPVPVPHTNDTTIEVQGQRRLIATPKSRRREQKIVQSSSGSESEALEQNARKGKEVVPETLLRHSPRPMDDSTMSISPEEIQRIAREINAERKTRKAAQAAKAAAAAKAAEEEEARLRREAELEVAKNLPLPDETVTVPAPAPAPRPSGHKGRRIVKVVYLMDDDNTEILELERQLSGDLANPARQTRDQPRQQQQQRPDVTEQLPPPAPLPPLPTPSFQPPPAALRTPKSPQKQQPPGQQPTVRFEAPAPESITLEVEPEAEPDILSDASNLTPRPHPLHTLTSDHNPSVCTVCIRYERLRRLQEESDRSNPLADFPAPELHLPPHSGNEDSTLRPSAPARVQLRRVVQQLKDEHTHLKILYQKKHEELMELDPSTAKSKRKALTEQIGELVIEMDAKSDQIYALYDVNEGLREADERDDDNGEGRNGGLPQYDEGETEDLIKMMERVSAGVRMDEGVV